MMSVLYLVLALVTLLLARVTITTGQDPQVRSPAGTFRGKVLIAPIGARYESYRGIPYALPPTGERRFAVPEPYPVIEGVYDATDFGPVCLQFLNNVTTGQEDCLFLNVFAPLSKGKTASESRLKSVLVFIHGGGYFAGSSNIYLPGDLVTKADILVVTLNYRLGWFGFLYGNSDSLPGNQAVWDMVLVLRWVKDNIRAFGGDPDDVTLSGESAGSIFTSMLSISPVAKGLFNKGIMMSATIFLFPSPPRTSNTLLETLSNQVGCGQTVDGNEEAIVRCLKEETALSFFFNFAYSIVPQLTPTGDDILPRSIQELLDDYEYLSDVEFFSRDYIVSVNKDTGYIMINSVLGKTDTSSIDSTARGLSDPLQTPEYLLRLLLTEYVKLYENLEKSAIALATDVFYIRQSLKFFEVFNRSPNQGKASNNAYFISFDHSPRYIQNQYMIHGLDLVYLFDIDPNDITEEFYNFSTIGSFSEEDVELKSYYIDLIGTFVNSGSGETNQYLEEEETNIVWPPFDMEKMSYLSFSLYPSVREDILASRRYIWQTLVPQWLQES